MTGICFCGLQEEPWNWAESVYKYGGSLFFCNIPIDCRYERVEELVWVKTNQLQRIIRTGRTGHWLNHSKEHCLVGVKGNPQVNRFIDCDVIVAEVELKLRF